MKYRIDVKEINYGCIEIEANSKEEAYSLAEAAYTMGQTIWSQGEYELTNAQGVLDRGGAR